MKKCSDCNHCLMIDYGYSNYTVEGTDVYCVLDNHPDSPFDNWYGTDKRLNFAETCENFCSDKGPVMVDVEEEGFYYSEDEKERKENFMNNYSNGVITYQDYLKYTK